MKFVIVTFVCIICVNALSEKEQWSTFKQNHGKKYKNIVEENYRFSVFQNNLREINEHNERYRNGETTYFLGVNKFADRTSTEFKSMFKNHKVNLPKSENIKSHELPKEVKTATSVDWRSKGFVMPVRDQGDCGNSWPFAAAAAYESQLAFHKNITVQLSTQQFIDCAVPFGEECNISGDIMTGFAYGSIRKTSIVPESEYPFVGAQSVCRANLSKGIVNNAYISVSDSTEITLEYNIGRFGPMASTINADCIQLYAGGIFSNSSCPNTLDDINFALLNVGYDTSSDGIDYWILKNSFGTDWGEEGYLRLKKGTEELGIPLLNGSPTILED